MFAGILEMIKEQNNLEQYGFTASKDRYMSASALEEIADYAKDTAHAETYKGAIAELKKLKEVVQWHIDNLENNDTTPCHKDDPKFHDERGS